MRAKTIWWDEAMRLFPRSANPEFELNAERERRAFMEGVLFSASQVILANMAAQDDEKEGAAPFTDADKQRQAKQCGCRGSDDLCPCQNVRLAWMNEAPTS